MATREIHMGAVPQSTIRETSTNSGVASAATKSVAMGVGTKVYGLVGLCLTLLTVVGGVALWQMNSIGTELEAIAERDIPMTAALNKVTIHQLEQAIQFERGFRFGEEMSRHPEVRKDFSETVNRFKQLSAQVEEELKSAEIMAEKSADADHTAAGKAEFHKVANALKTIEDEHKSYETRAINAFDLLEAGRIDDAIRIASGIVDLEDKLDHKLEALVFEIGNFTQKAASTAEAHEKLAIKLLAGITAAAFLIATFCAFVLVRMTVAKPLNALVASLDKLTAGDYESEIAVGANDEIGRVARALRFFRGEMIEARRLREEQQLTEKRAAEEKQRRELEKLELEAKAEQERRLAEEKAEAARKKTMIDMADTFERSIMGVVESLSSAATEMHSSAETLSATADQTTHQATAVAAASEEATVNVQTVASSAEELSASVNEISRQVIQSNQIAQSAVTEAQLTNDKVEGLATAAQKIGEVVSLINDIASQTNLLALNATIEAARAGEAGKGFAVVASEVKSLATQTGKATEEIGAQITEIQSATGEAVQAIRGIGATIGQMGEIASSISAAVEEQGAATREIASSVQQAAAGTQQVSGNITQVTQAANETQSSSGQLLDAAKELTQQGVVLRQEVDGFLETVRAA